MRTDVIHEEASGGLADEGDFCGIHMIGGGVGFYPGDRGLHVFDGLRQLGGGRKPVIDAEPGETGLCKWFEQGPDIRTLTAFIEAASMHENGRREWACAIGNV